MPPQPDNADFSWKDSFLLGYAPMDEVHEECSDMLAQVWGLPEEVREVIGNHHHFVSKGKPVILAAVVCVADAIAIELGRGTDLEIVPGMVLAAERYLDLDDQAMAQVRFEAEEVLHELDRG